MILRCIWDVEDVFIEGYITKGASFTSQAGRENLHSKEGMFVVWR